MNTKYIGYLRVSTKRQGRSGLGLEAQQAALDAFQSEHGRLLAVYQEVESGRNTTRPELLRAISHAKRSGATLVFAKLDRLSRDAAFLLNLQTTGLKMLFLDIPQANEFTVGIMALVAQHEARLISERTKAALAARRRRGLPLGAEIPECQNLTPKAMAKGRKAGSAAISLAACSAYDDIVTYMMDMRESGKSQQDIANLLNEQGHTTRRGKPWNQVQVMRVLRRAEAAFEA